MATTKLCKTETEVRMVFRHLPDITARQKKWMKEDILPEYVFYSRKHDYAYCSHCGAEFSPKEMEKTRHKMAAKCPKCGRDVTLHCMTFPHNICDEATAVVVSMMDGVPVVRYYDIGRCYRNWESIKEPYIHVDERVRDIYDARGGGAWLVFDNDGRWRQVDPNARMLHVRLPRKSVKVDVPGIMKMLKGTALEHCMLDRFMAAWRTASEDTIWLCEKYIGKYMKCPIDEYLYKCGLDSVVDQMWCETLGWTPHDERIGYDDKATTLQGMLGITRPQLKVLAADPKLAVKRLQLFQNGISDVEQADAAIGLGLGPGECGDILSQGATINGLVRHYGGKAQDWRDYRDYLNVAKELGWDMRNEHVLYPKDIAKAHDDANIFKALQSAEEAAQAASRAHAGYAKAMAPKLRRKFKFERDGMAVVVPATCGDIVREGQALRHCVGTYVSQVANGETVILFVRRDGEFDKPFYTMEVRNGRLRQVHGMCNKAPTPEVWSFVDAFCKKKHVVALSHGNAA